MLRKLGDQNGQSVSGHDDQRKRRSFVPGPSVGNAATQAMVAIRSERGAFGTGAMPSISVSVKCIRLVAIQLNAPSVSPRCHRVKCRDGTQSCRFGG